MRSNIAECRDCTAPIIWMKSKNNKNIPVDLDSATNDEQIEAENGEQLKFDFKRHICHFDTCEEREEK